MENRISRKRLKLWYEWKKENHKLLKDFGIKNSIFSIFYDLQVLLGIKKSLDFNMFCLGTKIEEEIIKTEKLLEFVSKKISELGLKIETFEAKGD